MSTLLTADVGGTNARYAHFADSTLSRLRAFDTPGSLTEWTTQIKDCIADGGALGLAIAVAGVNEGNRLVINSPNLSWLNGTDVRNWAEQTFNIPCWIVNDVEASVVAEAQIGALRDIKRCATFEVISTGWGGCTLIRSETGDFVIPGEPGHTLFRLDGPICGCGNQGCYEAEVSGWAISERVAQLFDDRFPNSDPCKLLDQAASERHSWALEIYAHVARVIACGWASTLNRNSWIEKIVFQGTFLKHAMKHIRESLQTELDRRTLYSVHKGIPIVESDLWPNGAHLGASVVFARCEARIRKRCCIASETLKHM